MLRSLQAQYSATAVDFAGKNAIVVLGLGTETPHDLDGAEVGMFAYGRLTKALEVYEACKRAAAHCTVIVSGGDSQGHGATEAEVYADRLRTLGVPNEDLVTESKSSNTWENALNCAPILTQLNAEHVFLVTSAVHLRRSLVYFHHFGIDAHPVRADYLAPFETLVPLSYNVLLTDLALHEYLGLARYRVYNALHLNPPAVLPARAD